MCTGGHYPRFLSRDELLASVWGTEHLTANALSNAVSKLRQALDDDADQPRYVQTERAAGYRLMVQPIPAGAARREPWSLVGKRRWIAVALILTGIAVAWSLTKRGSDPLADYLISNPGNWVVEVEEPGDDDGDDDQAPESPSTPTR